MRSDRVRSIPQHVARVFSAKFPHALHVSFRLSGRVPVRLLLRFAARIAVAPAYPLDAQKAHDLSPGGRLVLVVVVVLKQIFLGNTAASDGSSGGVSSNEFPRFGSV